MRRSRRGFTLAETVVALAIILIVSLSAFSLIISSQSATQTSLYKRQAQNFAEDVVACFRVSEPDEFSANLAFAYGAEVKLNDENFTLNSGYKAWIQVSGNTVTVTVKDGDKVVVETSFTKGGGGA